MSPPWFARSDPSACIVSSNWLCSTIMTLSDCAPFVSNCNLVRACNTDAVRARWRNKVRAATSVIAACDGGAEATLGVGRRRCRHGRNGQGGDGSEGHQCFPHGFTFLMEQRQRISSLS